MTEYRCTRCYHLLFKGSLKLLLAKQHDRSLETIEPKCPKRGQINKWHYDQNQTVVKTR